MKEVSKCDNEETRHENVRSDVMRQECVKEEKTRLELEVTKRDEPRR